jgi:DnaK suppressor protein
MARPARRGRAKGEQEVARSSGRKKRASKTNASGVEVLRKKLLKQRQEILDLYEHDLRVGQESADDGTEDIVDRANNAYNREFMFSLSNSERNVLIQIEGALSRLDEGTYGACTNCGEPIAKARLRALPWATYCIDCQEKDELGALNDS